MKIATLLAVVALAAGLSTAKANEQASVLDPDAKLEKIAHGFRYLEGPVWHPQGWLLFSDIPGDTIYKWTPGPAARRGNTGLPAALAGTLRVYRRPSNNSNGLALDSHGRLIACEHGRRVTISDGDEATRTLADKYEGKRLNSPNDLAIRSDGSIYFTDPPYGISNPKERELDFSGIYRITVDGRLSVLDKHMPFPNGIAFSPDGSKLYVVDSEANHIVVYDVLRDGSIVNPRLFANVNLAGSHEGPDSMKVDDLGNVFCAGPDGVWIFAPNGSLIGKILMPEVPSNVAFGDDDRSTLYVTARTGLYRIRLKTSGHGTAASPR